MTKRSLPGLDAQQVKVDDQQAKQGEHEHCHRMDIDEELGAEDGVGGTHSPVAAVNLSVGGGEGVRWGKEVVQLSCSTRPAVPGSVPPLLQMSRMSEPMNWAKEDRMEPTQHSRTTHRARWRTHLSAK
ncbi:hypothetical protein EYF80_000465 [Liparis tanakae]|uniref:Uncharacterized protein n=1 Tax=Liparis tanakae TaxID=230148 RepID=A0A4Z2JGU6_9TELE|nr:hypothetical protein EYF80_000465 [Liparis tanakae]